MSQRSVINNDMRNPGYVLLPQSPLPTCQILDTLPPTIPLHNHHLQELTPGLWILVISQETVLRRQAEPLGIQLLATNL